MSDLYWPGDERAGDHFTSSALVAAMIEVESEWAGVELGGLVGADDLERLGAGADAAGSPVLGLVELLRQRSGHAEVHRGLTSQDVLDTATMRMAGAAVSDLQALLSDLVGQLVELATAHRDTAMVARTLTRHAVPTTFGLRVARWLDAVLDADEDLARLTFPDQLGGAAGTRAAMVELGRHVDLHPLPWHTTRAPVTRLGDALAAATDACARIANDVVVMSRPEIAELAEGAPGGSSTMPGKANPVLSVLVRRAALTTPQLAATLHLAAATQVDERADGAWHAEWATLRDLVRRTLIAASQTADLLRGLRVHPARMAAILADAGDAVRAEQRAMAESVGRDPAADYLGQAGRMVDAVVDRARAARASEEQR